MITKKDYKEALKIVKQYEKEQSEKWSCDKCDKYFTNPFDQSFCHEDFDIENDITCKGKYYTKEE